MNYEIDVRGDDGEWHKVPRRFANLAELAIAVDGLLDLYAPQQAVTELRVRQVP